jgi:hypothetical protein
MRYIQISLSSRQIRAALEVEQAFAAHDAMRVTGGDRRGFSQIHAGIARQRSGRNVRQQQDD